MSTSETPTLRLRPRDYAPGENAVLAGIWRRAWISAQHGEKTVAPIGLWLSRVQAEFVPPADVLLAERDEQIVGFMMVLAQRNYVAQLFIEPHLQREGLGQSLLDEACVRMPTGWRLHVATANIAAQRFYERYGLERGVVDRHPSNGRERVAYHWAPRIGRSMNRP
jgi:putative acetyltransferase